MTTTTTTPAQKTQTTGAADLSAIQQALDTLKKENETLKAHLSGRDRHNSKLETELNTLRAQINSGTQQSNVQLQNDSVLEELGELAGPISQLIKSEMTQLDPKFDGILSAIKGLGDQTGSTNDSVFRSALTQQLTGYEKLNSSDEFKIFLDAPIEFTDKTLRDVWEEAIESKDATKAASMWNKFSATNPDLLKSQPAKSVIEPNISLATKHAEKPGETKTYTPADLAAKTMEMQTGKITNMQYAEWKEKVYEPNKAQEAA